jgi:hypothetical protein
MERYDAWMRRILASVVGVASVPVGVAVGLWMASLTRTPSCPVKGLGTAALCVPRPVFTPGLCVVCGAAAAAVLLLISLTARRPVSAAGVFDLAAAEVGILIGVWFWMLTYASLPCGPSHVCIGSLPGRFPSWMSAVIGAVAMGLILGIGAAASSDLRRANLSAGRSMRDWLFKDLSNFAATRGPGPGAA